ncbi:carbohydrate kinase [uncultured Sulfitobacter sp.]|uniref:carbohydrate kinase family protein n=1 Tax=uncultured Sulfitobacter sp. TaxID=191468 RepID=UPI00262E480C|nr:carbohydrate kinase [uncultured Sulfitobacter sp.]
MILCCGEALIDMIPTATTQGPDGFVPHSGGAVFNTAIALGRLGAQTGMLSGISTDMFGRQLIDGLEASHVNTSRVIFSDRPTTLAFVQLTDGHATYDFYDENSAGRMLVPDDMPRLTDEITALFFGGISLACEPCADAYAALLLREADQRVIMMDPNIRPGFIKDIPRYRTRLTSMITKADIIKVSDEDLNWIMPDITNQQVQIAALLDSGPSLVVLTRGSEGATGFVANGTEVSVPAQNVVAVDTVGAGDTFNAGILAKLSQLGLLGKTEVKNLDATTLETVLQYGAKVASITVSRSGANPPWAKEL